MTESRPFLLDVLRHGATAQSGAFLGRTDAELTPAGRDAMAARVHGRRWSAVHSSPRLRCRAFAARLHHDAVVEPGFAEYDFGEWDGRPVRELMRTEAAAVEAFWRDPAGCPPPGAEHLAAFRARVREATQTLIGNRFDAGQPVLLVTHAGVMRALLEQFLAIPLVATWNIELPPAALMRLAFDVADGEILHARLVRLEGA